MNPKNVVKKLDLAAARTDNLMEAAERLYDILTGIKETETRYCCLSWQAHRVIRAIAVLKRDTEKEIVCFQKQAAKLQKAADTYQRRQALLSAEEGGGA